MEDIPTINSETSSDKSGFTRVRSPGSTIGDPHDTIEEIPSIRTQDVPSLDSNHNDDIPTIPSERSPNFHVWIKTI